MKIIIINNPNSNLINSLQSIIDSCNEYDKMAHPSYLDPEMPFYPEFRNYYIAFEDDIPVGFISVFTADGFCADAYAFTLPQYRRRGIFNTLWNNLWNEIKDFDYESVNFNILPDNSIGKDILLQYGAYHNHTECIMRFDSMGNILDKTKDINSSLSLTWEEKDGIITYTLWKKSILSHRSIGSCRIYTESNCATVFDFNIAKAMRYKGYGSSFINMVTHELCKREYNHIILHVSSSNTSAYNMYLHNGFSISSRLDVWSIDNIQKTFK
ncbi:MAG: GNAT family N-acetyltransferase [Eubacterium sp.]